MAAAVALALSTSAAYALPTLNTVFDGVVDPFGGFDWNSAGSAMVTLPGPLTSGDAITTQFMSNATGIKLVGGATFPTANLFPVNPSPDYEYTIYATINETVSCGPVGTVCGNLATFTATGGSWTVFYGVPPNSNLVTGAGITDGTAIIAGNIVSGGGNFNNNVICNGTQGGSGDFAFSGSVTFTNPAFVSALNGSTAGSTLQIGGCTTAWTQPTSFAALGGGTQGIPLNALLFQADANQTFTPLPEPGSLAVFGLVLAAASAFSRKRRQSE